MNQSPDLERIMSYFQQESGETPARYVEFPVTLPQPVRPVPEPRRLRPTPPLPKPPPPEVQTEAPVSEPPLPIWMPSPPETRISGEWPALDEALGRVRTGGRPPEEPWSSILMTGLVGGTGRTLLLVSLATTLALKGRPAILVDLNGTSFLPFLFIGSHKVDSTRVGRVWTSYFHGGHQIPLLSVRAENPLGGKLGPGTDLTFSDLYYEIRAEAPSLFSLNDLSRPVILVDLDASGLPIFEEMVSQALMVLSPVLPEIPSLLAVKEMENYFGTLETAKGIYCERYYLPNRFSGENPFHLHLMGRFQWLLNRRLCPVVVPDDPGFETLLARGEPFPTILTQNGIARSLEPLLGWMIDQCDALNRSRRAKAGNPR